MTQSLLRDPSVDSGDRHVNQPLGLCSALLSTEEERGKEEEESREWEEGLDESCKTHVQKWENYFHQLQTCAAGFGGGGMIKTSVLSKEDPICVIGVKIETV